MKIGRGKLKKLGENPVQVSLCHHMSHMKSVCVNKLKQMQSRYGIVFTFSIKMLRNSYFEEYHLLGYDAV
jgi:hypothetical protein